MDFTRGQRLKLEALGLSDGAFSVTVDLNTGPFDGGCGVFWSGRRSKALRRALHDLLQPACHALWGGEVRRAG